jgi:hypothetical protein
MYIIKFNSLSQFDNTQWSVLVNKYILLAIVSLANVSGVVKAKKSNFESIQKVVKKLPYQRANQAYLISLIVLNDKELEIRYIKNAEFYARKSKYILDKDNLVDLVLYPVVDTVVGNGMSKLNEIECVHNAMNNISPSNRKFLLNNVQLITSAVFTKLISIETTKGLDKANGDDVKNFGKACAAQVGCDVADEYVVRPAVKMLVDDENSWTAIGLREVGKCVLGQCIINRVNQI